MLLLNFKNELFYGDTIRASVVAKSFQKSDLIFFINWKRNDGKNISVVIAKTGMICYDYSFKENYIHAGGGEK